MGFRVSSIKEKDNNNNNKQMNHKTRVMKRKKTGKEKNTLNWHSYFHHIKSAICSWHSLLSLGRFSQFRHSDEERWRINQINSQFGKFSRRPFSSISIPSFLPAHHHTPIIPRKATMTWLDMFMVLFFSHLHKHNSDKKGDRHCTPKLIISYC